MPDFLDVALEYERIKDDPEKLDQIRSKEHRVKGKAADALDKRQKALPTPEVHAKLEETYEKMFDTTARAGAQSTLHGLILPNGRKNFSDFHDNYTGTGRMPKKETPALLPPDNAPKVDTRKDMAMLFERCPDCCERVDKNNCEPNFTIIPPFEKLPPQEAHRWQSLNLTPGIWVCWLYCRQCPRKAAEGLAKIKNDPALNMIAFANADGTPKLHADGSPYTLADKQAGDFIRKRADRISDTVHKMFQKERDNPLSQAFYGSARITGG